MCGVTGVFNVPNASQVLAMCLHAIQNRGGDGTGIITYDSDGKHSFKSPTRVSESFLKTDKTEMEKLTGDVGIGHCRYATAPNSNGPENIQPIGLEIDGAWISIAHNGNFPDFEETKKTNLSGETFFFSSRH